VLHLFNFIYQKSKGSTHKHLVNVNKMVNRKQTRYKQPNIHCDYNELTDDEINCGKMRTDFRYDHSKEVGTFTVDQTTHNDNSN